MKRKYASIFWNASFIRFNVFVPAIVLTAYFLVFAALLPLGVSQVFAEQARTWSLALAAGSGLVMLGLPGKQGEFSARSLQSQKTTASDLIFLLLPLSPVAQYIIRNQDILAFGQVAYVAAIFAGYSLLLIVIIPKLLNRYASERTLMLLGAAFSFVMLSMAALSRQFSWFEEGSFGVQMFIFGAIFIGSWLLYDLGYKRLLHLLVVMLFIGSTASQVIAPADIEGLAFGVNMGEEEPSVLPEAVSDRDVQLDTENQLVQLIAGRAPLSRPDIYLLVYDAYPPNETLLSYGIDNRLQADYLIDQGFILYPHTYSVAASSLRTVSRVLDVSADFDGSRRAVSGGSAVHALLGSFGYSTYGVFGSDFFFREADVVPSYDFSYPVAGESGALISEAIFKGEFRFDEGFDEVPYEEFLEAKREVLGGISSDPVFVYSHSNYPGHSQNSGQCLPNETELFAERLQVANAEIRQDVAMLVESHPDAIIIIAGDHGPYLTKNCDILADYDLEEITRQDVQDRFGTFLAIRWPSAGFEDLDRIVVLQDIFPAIFAYLFDDPSLLDARIGTRTGEHERVGGVRVIDGIIEGGANDGEPLFVGGQ